MDQSVLPWAGQLPELAYKLGSLLIISAQSRVRIGQLLDPKTQYARYNNVCAVFPCMLVKQQTSMFRQHKAWPAGCDANHSPRTGHADHYH